MSSVHLLVLIHGMWGHPGHLAEMDRIIRETRATNSKDDVQLKVLLAEANRHEGTYDGIDWGGERVAQEIMSELEKLEEAGKTVTRFSVAGYSLGGLVARYLVGILHSRGFFDTITPVNFCTVATPHLGILKSAQLQSIIRAAIGPRLLSRTGEQFYCVDKWSTTGKPLLEVMADPQGIFYQTLLKFPHLRIYANAINDATVPYLTAAIETEDPFAYRSTNGIQIMLDEKYGPLIKSYTLPEEPPLPVARPVVFSRRWFRNLKPETPLLPPLLQFAFPLNILLYILLPIIIPSALSLLVVRLSWASYNSRLRIKLLENDESHRHSLVYSLENLEKKVDDVVADLIDDPGSESTTAAQENADQPAETTNEVSPRENRDQPLPIVQVLSPLQLRIAAFLNTLPHLKKETAFIERVRNSHAPIVCRDVKRFSMHRAGEGVLRHLADNFIL